MTDEISKLRIVVEGICVVSLAYRAHGDGGTLLASISHDGYAVEGAQLPCVEFQFQNIGHGDPLEFLFDLDDGYLCDRIFGVDARQIDMVQTIINLRAHFDERVTDGDLTARQRFKLERHMDASLAQFDGNHEASVYALIQTLHQDPENGLSDDPFHMAGHRENEKAGIFLESLWRPAMAALEAAYPSGWDVNESEEFLL